MHVDVGVMICGFHAYDNDNQCRTRYDIEVNFMHVPDYNYNLHYLEDIKRD